MKTTTHFLLEPSANVHIGGLAVASQTKSVLHVFAVNKRTDTITHISDVERGNEHCVCIECGERLIPKRGEILTHHFAHNPETSCSAGSNGGGGSETIFHLLLKEAICHSNTIPFVTGDLLDDTAALLGMQNAIRDSHLEITETAMEKMLLIGNEKDTHPNKKYQPDVKCKLAGKELAIEITYSHKTSENKKQNLLNADIDTIEITLDKYRLPNIEKLIELRSNELWDAIIEAFRSCIHYELPKRWLNAQTALIKANQHTELKEELDNQKQQNREAIHKNMHLEKRLNAELSAHRARHDYFKQHYGAEFFRNEELEQRLIFAENKIHRLRQELRDVIENFECLNAVFLSEFPNANLSDLIEEQRRINLSEQIKKELVDDNL